MSNKQFNLPLEYDPDPDHPPNLPARVIREQGIVEEALTILARRHRRGEVLSSPKATQEFLRLKLAEQQHEVFGCIFLDNRHRIIDIENLFFGTIDGDSVHARAIVQKALQHNAAAILAYHNHPSGITEPSQADLSITQRIKNALALVDIRLLDHLVVSVEGATSIAERGLM